MNAIPDRPLVSAIIPCFNCERYLAEAIESARAQSYAPVELIVIDDGSTDRSGEVARSFGEKIRYRRQPHGGIAAARNSGVELATGEYIAFLDSDDLWPPDKLELQMAAFEDDPSAGAICGYVEQFVSPELPESFRTRVAFNPDRVPARLPGAMLIRRSVLDRVGTFSGRFVTGTEIDWQMRAADLGVQVVLLPDLVLRRRIHASNHGVLHKDARGDYVRVLKAALDRRRTGAGGSVAPDDPIREAP